MNLLEGLNDQQQAATKHVNGPLLVVAGAGTGKTRVITHRIAYLIAEGHAKPGQVLALTFTEKAAREMADRLYELIGWQSFSVPVMTFNAFGAELLGRYAGHIGRSTRGGLINDTQKSLLLQQRFDQLSLEYYGLQSDIFAFMSQLVTYIGRLQNAGVTSVQYRKFVDELSKNPGDRHPADVAEQRDLATIYELYDHIKAETGTYDYYDQLALPLQILRQRPNLSERLRAQYPYVLVDEYQDTSPVQDELLREFVPADGNMFAVGDDDQAIYGFRGADIENILHFTEHFHVETPVALIENYRSGQPILDAAYRLICHNNPERLEEKLHINKRLVASRPDAVVAFTPYQAPADEQTAVIDAIVAKIEGGEKPGELAVLARSNATLKLYARALRARDVPFAISTEVNIFEQRELISLWYLLQWVQQRASDEAIAHVVMGPFVGWTAADWRRVVIRSATDLSDAETALRALGEEGDILAAELAAKLDMWRSWTTDETVSRLSYRLVFETGLAERLMKSGETNPRIVRVFEDLHRLLTHMQDYETVAVDATLAGYLGQFPEPPAIEVAETAGEEQGVQLLTVHASKGLEFNVVYLVHCTARAWSAPPATGLVVPPELAIESSLPPEHEQRRLLYVAATRARHELYLSAPTESAGGGQRQKITPLLGELLGEGFMRETPVLAATKSDKVLQKLQQFYPLKTELPDVLPFETSDGWIELGISGLKLYDESPHDFYLQYVLKISQPFGPQLAFGTAVHGAIQAFYEAQLRHEPVTLAELEARLDELWSDRGYVSQEQAATARQRAHETLVRFVGREQDRPATVEATELPIRLEIPEAKLRLHGRIDATFRPPEGLEVRDFKTGNIYDAEKLNDKAKTSFQLRSYALAIEQLTGSAPAKVTLDYVVTGAEGCAELTARVLANHRDKLIKLAERLRQRDFDPGASSDFNRAAAFRYYGTESDDDEVTP